MSDEKYVITAEQISKWIELCYNITDAVAEMRSHHLSEHDAEQCNTCKLKDKRSCIYHGYPASTIPSSCSYKLGIDCERSLHNLNGTGIDVWTKEHDAAVAKKERERVLESLKQKFDHEHIKSESDFIIYKFICHSMESLRGERP